MPEKKIQKYVPQTKLPALKMGWRVLLDEPIENIFSILKAKHEELRRIHRESGSTERLWLPYERQVARWDSGEINSVNYQQIIGQYYHKNILNYVYTLSPQFKETDRLFMAEFDSREDLQLIYRDCVSRAHWVYDIDDNHMSVDDNCPYRERPQTFRMFQGVVGRYGRSDIELSRPTPYVEGDLVLLRDTAVDTDADPLQVRRWSPAHQAGQVTPGKEVQRIGTVISVTGQVARSWNPVKGSKVLKIMWLGINDAKIVDVEERYLKWHERPTLKNGMKTRE